MRRASRSLRSALLVLATGCAPVLAPHQRAPVTLHTRPSLRERIGVPPGIRAARREARKALAAGDFERARAALARAARGPDAPAAIVALGRLEVDHGRVGTGLLHLARADRLDARALAGDRRLCALFEQRARLALAASMPAFAYEDVARIDRLCPSNGSARVALRRAALAGIDAARRTQVHPPPPPAGARDRPPWPLRALAPKALVAELEREARGAYGPILLPDEALRAMAAGQPFGPVEQAARTLGPGWAAYARLRLGRVIRTPPYPREVLGENGQQFEISEEITDEQQAIARLSQAYAEGWIPAGALARAFAIAGDPEALAATVREVRGEVRDGAAVSASPGETGDGAPVRATRAGRSAWPWLAVRAGLAGARLGPWLARGRALARAEAGHPAGRLRLTGAVSSLLVTGHPYRAAALVTPEVAEAAPEAAVRVSAALALVDAWCGERPCLALPEAVAVGRAIGRRPLAEALAELLLHAPAAPPAPCPSAQPRGPVGEGPARAIEADPLLACGLWENAAGLRRDPAAAAGLLDLIVLGGEDLPPGAEIPLADLAYAVGDTARAGRLLRDGLARTPEHRPRAVEVAVRAGDEVLLAELLRDAFADAGGLSEADHRRLVLVALGRAGRFEGETPAGRAALGRVVEDFVRAAPPGEGWGRRHRLVDAVLAGAVPPAVVGALTEILLPPPVAEAFEPDRRRLLRAAGGEARGGRWAGSPPAAGGAADTGVPRSAASAGREVEEPPPGPVEAALWPAEALAPSSLSAAEAALAAGRPREAVLRAAGVFAVAPRPSLRRRAASVLQSAAAATPGAADRVRRALRRQGWVGP